MRYQATVVGRRRHAQRQRRYREQQTSRAKVTHQGTQLSLHSSSLPTEPAAMAIEAMVGVGRKEAGHVGREEAGGLRCAFCGRAARFVRLETVAQERRRHRLPRVVRRAPWSWPSVPG